MCVCVCVRAAGWVWRERRDRERKREGVLSGADSKKNGGLHTSPFKGDREKEAGTEQEARACVNRTLHIYASPGPDLLSQTILIA